MGAVILLLIDPAAQKLGLTPAFVHPFGVVDLGHLTVARGRARKVEYVVLGIESHVGAVHPVGVEPPLAQRAGPERAVGCHRSAEDLGEDRVEVDEVKAAGLLALHGGVEEQAVIDQHRPGLAARGVDGCRHVGHLIAGLGLDRNRCNDKAEEKDYFVYFHM